MVDRLLQVPGINTNDVRAADALLHASQNGHHAVVDILLEMQDIGVDDGGGEGSGGVKKLWT